MENKVLAAKVVLISWIIIIVTSLVMWIFDSTFLLSKSFILGGAVSLFGFTQMNKNAVIIVETRNPKRAYSGYFIRFALSAVVIGYTYMNPDRFNWIPTFIGLFVTKISMMGYLLVKKGVIIKNDEL